MYKANFAFEVSTINYVLDLERFYLWHLVHSQTTVRASYQTWDCSGSRRNSAEESFPVINHSFKRFFVTVHLQSVVTYWYLQCESHINSIGLVFSVFGPASGHGGHHKAVHIEPGLAQRCRVCRTQTALKHIQQRLSNHLMNESNQSNVLSSCHFDIWESRL